MSETILVAHRLFDGEAMREDVALVIRDGFIVDIVPRSQLAQEAIAEVLPDGVLAPGFIDVQVNGGGGRMLNNAPTVETVDVMAKAHRRFGTTAMLPTLITDTREISERAVDAVLEATLNVPGVTGLHLEGPHLAPGRRGAHLAELMRPLEEADIAMMRRLAFELPVLHLTLAAEQVQPLQVELLAAAGVVVSIGHTNCTAEEARILFDAGARGVTHLFNAMSGFSHRAPGLVGAALDEGQVWCGVIADGHHVDPTALRVALRAKRGPGRLFHVTDAMALVGSQETEFSLNGRAVRREPGEVCSRLVLEDGTLAGSDLDMASAVRFGVQKLDLSLEESLAMATSYPARYLGLEEHHGLIKPGARADMVWLDDALHARATWISGRRA
ncbi:N-acetylglucosamine-6-phosphate deacetylase [Nitratireductor sp. CH_MIT9313-5]|uniref:N-acetylglucosamine-6-phosphate deacetylase n=1 Tax=Nitratireductor sp. CH_MIT9313-5 TaxID=3107764 RepID=UPI003009F0F4